MRDVSIPGFQGSSSAGVLHKTSYLHLQALNGDSWVLSIGIYCAHPTSSEARLIGTIPVVATPLSAQELVCATISSGSGGDGMEQTPPMAHPLESAGALE